MLEKDFSYSETVKGLISDYDLELCSPPCIPGAETWSARASLRTDITAVLPFLNAKLEGADYDHGAGILIWKDHGHSFAFRSREIKAAPARDREEARILIDRAVALINKTWCEREGIEPSYEKRTLPNLMQIYHLLPRTNCGKCGFVTCMAFAAKLREGEAELSRCPELMQQDYGKNRKDLAEMLTPLTPSSENHRENS
jgi:ArsR family metal-binding transcriptional regulator